MKTMKIMMTAWLLLAAGWAFAGSPELFVFDSGVGRGTWTPEQQAAILKELGYDGISYNYTNLKEMAERIEAFKAQDLKIFAIYIYTFPDRADAPYDPSIKEAIKLLKGSDTQIWVTLRETKDKTRSYDAEAVKIVQDLADQAAAQGLRVALYPHAGFTMANAADAVRFAKAAGRPNVSPSLNLCHEFHSGQAEKLDETIALAAPLSSLISINGVDVAGKKYVLRLDQGDFDLATYLKKVVAAGYQGPVGIQFFQVAGEIRDNLVKTMETWQAIKPETKAEPEQ